MERFCTARVAIVGLGGVGSWAAEALARSGVGALTLIDLDHIAESNTNRQVHALGNEYGRAKALAMAERVGAIHPGSQVHAIEEFLDAGNCARILAGTELVIDCIDDARAKAAMLAHARAAGIPAITCGAAGGRMDPTRVRVCDLARATGDPLLASVRHRLRKDHGFPAARNGRAPARMEVEAVFSDEPIRPAQAASPDGEPAGFAPAVPGAPLACAGYGSCVTVTATFGLVAASRVLERLAMPL